MTAWQIGSELSAEPLELPVFPMSET
jgi:hypothetical protein